MNIYFIVRGDGQQQETYHPALRQFVPRDESEGFARRYKNRSAAVRRAKLLGANVVVGKQWLDIGNAVFTQPGQSFADGFKRLMEASK